MSIGLTESHVAAAWERGEGREAPPAGAELDGNIITLGVPSKAAQKN
jgi:hypothetical protein